jgi:hypothetical protein
LAAPEELPGALALTKPLTGFGQLETVDLASDSGGEVVDTDADNILALAHGPTVTWVITEGFGSVETVDVIPRQLGRNCGNCRRRFFSAA